MIQTSEFLLHCYYVGSVDNLSSWNKFQTYTQGNGGSVALRVPELGTFLKRYSIDMQYMAPLDYSVNQYSTL